MNKFISGLVPSKKIFVGKIIFFGGVLLILLVGCARKSKKSDKILLRWMGYGYRVYDKVRTEESKKFAKIYPNVIVKYEPVYASDFRSKILTEISGGSGPDLFFARDLQSYISKGTLVDLSNWIRQDKKYFKKIYPILMEAQTWDGKIYALPGNCNVDILYYNKTLFNREGIPYPDETWTWEKLLKVAKKLTKKDSNGAVVQFGCVSSIGGSQYIHYIYQNGGKLWNKNKTRCVINSPESRYALNFWRDLYTKYRVSPTINDFKTQGLGKIFTMGKGAIYCGNSCDVAVFNVLGGKNLNWDATLMPKAGIGKKRFSFLIYNSLGIWSGSKNSKMAYELAKFMNEPEKIKFLVHVGDSLPMRPSGEAMDYYLTDPNKPERAKKSMLKALSYARSEYRLLVNPKIPYMEQDQIIKRELDRFTTCGVSAEEVLKKIENKLNELLTKK